MLLGRLVFKKKKAESSKHHQYFKKSKTQLDKTTTMAVDPEIGSRSWICSNILGRACGSIFATALIEVMARTEGKRHIMETHEDYEKGHTAEQ